MIFSKAAPSDDLECFLESWSLCVDPRLQERYPLKNWSELYSSTYKACKLAMKGNDTQVLVPPVPKPAEIGTSSRPSGFDTPSGLKMACTLAATGDDASILVPPIPKPHAESIGTSSRPSGLGTPSGLKMSRFKRLFRYFKS